MSSMSSRIVDLVKDESLAELTKDSAEIILDSTLEEGLLKDIPLVGMMFGIRKVYLSVQDKLFVKKLITFLEQIEEIPAAEREKQIEQINKDPDFTGKIGEKLLFILNKADDTEKAKYIGILFKNFLKRKIKLSEFIYASHIVNNMFIDDLNWFIKQVRYANIDLESSGEFVANGLYSLNLKTKNMIGIDRGEVELDVAETHIGKLLRKILSEG